MRLLLPLALLWHELTYDGESLVFEGAACLEKGEVYLEAPLLRYLESAQRLEGVRSC